MTGDGIHGVTFASVELHHRSETMGSGAVQIGNPIEEKRLLDACLVCRDEGLIHAITDCGAGGFSSAIGEMARRLGADVQLDRAPLKYSGLAPWEVFLSESQERMVMAVAPEDGRMLGRRPAVAIPSHGYSTGRDTGSSELVGTWSLALKRVDPKTGAVIFKKAQGGDDKQDE